MAKHVPLDGSELGGILGGLSGPWAMPWADAMLGEVASSDDAASTCCSSSGDESDVVTLSETIVNGTRCHDSEHEDPLELWAGWSQHVGPSGGPAGSMHRRADTAPAASSAGGSRSLHQLQLGAVEEHQWTEELECMHHYCDSDESVTSSDSASEISVVSSGGWLGDSGGDNLFGTDFGSSSHDDASRVNHFFHPGQIQTGSSGVDSEFCEWPQQSTVVMMGHCVPHEGPAPPAQMLHAAPLPPRGPDRSTVSRTGVDRKSEPHERGAIDGGSLESVVTVVPTVETDSDSPVVAEGFQVFTHSYDSPPYL